MKKNNLIFKKLFLPGHGGFEWQNISSVSRPTHTRPPNAGAGFPQILFLTFTAEPQLCVHADQSDQLDHCPCTVQLVTYIYIREGKIKYKNKYYIFINGR